MLYVISYCYRLYNSQLNNINQIQVMQCHLRILTIVTACGWHTEPLMQKRVAGARAPHCTVGRLVQYWLLTRAHLGAGLLHSARLLGAASTEVQ